MVSRAFPLRHCGNPARRPRRVTDGALPPPIETAPMNRSEKGVAIMRNLFKYGGVAASVVLIAFGAGSIAIGAWGISTVRDNLKQEQIYFGDHATDPNVPADQSGKQVTTGSQAAIRRGVNARDTRPRIRPWRGGSMAMNELVRWASGP